MEHSTILEDDQQLYDWGIERLDQYYLNNENPSQQQQHHAAAAAAAMHHAGSEYPYNNNNNNNNNTHYEGYSAGDPHSVHHHCAFISQAPHSVEQKSCSNNTPSSPQRDQGDLIRSLTNHFSNSNRNIIHNKRQFLPQAVDMDINESLKVERKRARNRVAASKCRLRKLERISILDQQASQLRADNDELANLSTKLKAEIFALKEELNWHINNGCKIWYSDSGYMDHKSSQSTDSASSSPLPHQYNNANIKQEALTYSPGQKEFPSS